MAVVGGAEGLIHVARQWITIHRREEDMILLQKIRRMHVILYDRRNSCTIVVVSLRLRLASRNMIIPPNRISYTLESSIRIIRENRDVQ